MPAQLSAASLERLGTVHPDLKRVVKRCATFSRNDFGVTEGVRTLERQKELVARGKSKTLRSAHLAFPDGYGHAVDLTLFINGKPTWKPLQIYKDLAQDMRRAARELNVRIRWGGDWDDDGIPVDEDPDESFFDGPHFELHPAVYGRPGSPSTSTATTPPTSSS